ncbi:SET domain protein [Akanthomyces lecanii RCEF 1005]|uniref:SET domain protein n=1 Tax=Akanthomyces lecanii RCEF 1005 TaxID=1081108 RepID=A0A168INH8_CORDF|nr:SET domain protein [Akanthomyces lecanii RCEF 1005]
MKDALRGQQKEVGEELMLAPNGIWCTASCMNHSCVANCCRSFIGDMMIIRASEDIPASTELQVLYRPLSPAETYESTQQKFANWDFSCGCYLCEMKKTTTKTDMRQRQANLQSLSELVARPGPLDTTRARLLLKQIDKTYKKSGQRALKFGLQSGYFGFGMALFRRGNLVEAASALIRVLEVGGFVLAARAASNHQSAAVIETQKWGSYSHHALFTIINLYWICWGTDTKPFLPNHTIRMRTYAETAYAILVGEKETFTDTLEL